MFTGIIEELGTVVDLILVGTSLCLKIEAQRVFSEVNSIDERLSPEGGKSLQNGLKIGDSIAVNGVCMTVERVGVDEKSFTPPYFEVTAVRETLGKTTLGSLIAEYEGKQAGQRVNLERAATLETRLGGHLVQGHVDGLATVIEIRDLDGSWEFFFDFGRLEGLPHAGRYIVPQGSITLDGVSLTVAAIENNIVKIAIIPHTYYHTNFENLEVGDKVNVEFDVIAKMVERLVKPYR